MNTTLIWDLDGTLFDSYDVIVESIYLVLQENGIDIPKEEIHYHAIAFSIKSLFTKISQETGISAETLQQRYSQISGSKYLQIKPMTNAIEVLEKLEGKGISNLVFTHRGKTTIPVLDNLNMTHFFGEIITSQSGFARKPDPDALKYLLKKYKLDQSTTYYVGDRSIDMDCAHNAGIPGILFLAPGCVDVSGGTETFVVHDLLEILDII